MAIKVSSLIEKQLPEFISTHYAAFSTFLEKYYESLEITGQPLDILSNISSYYDINFYSKNILEEGTTLASSLNSTADEIILTDGSSFPEEYGYVKINNEICFYTNKTGNTLTGVFRGVSGTTRLGDLYNKTEYTTSVATTHSNGSTVENISNLFLFAIIKSFESQYLGSIPSKYLKKSVDKRTLIKNITDFYKAKGSEQSIEFVFNTLVSDDPSEVATVRRPSEQTLKSSESDWISNYEIYLDVISGNPYNLIGQEITQQSPYASFVVDNILSIDEGAVKISIDRESVIGEFEYGGYTKLVSSINSSDSSNFNLEVISTLGWKSTNKKIYIGNEILTIASKNVNQFTIESRTGSSSYAPNTKLYTKKPLSINGVKFQISAVVYQLNPVSKQPHSYPGSPILESSSAKKSINPVVYSEETGSYRWISNQNRQRPFVPTLTTVQNQLNNTNADVSALFEDDLYFYICSSGYPSTQILTGTTQTFNLEDNKFLKLIRKSPIINTEIYPTGYYDVGIFVDGTLAYGTKSDSFVKYGPIEKVNILNKGIGYVDPPYVLVNNSPTKARAILSGGVVSDLEILTEQIYQKTPSVVITSGRKAEVRAIVTAGKITSIVIENPGEYYSSAPNLEIRDLSGKGKFAEIRAEISSNGKLIGYTILNPGSNYSSTQTIVNVVPKGSGADASVEIKKWFKNRYLETTEQEIDNNGGALLNKKFSNKYTYGILSNPRRLRSKINDNVNTLLNENPNGHSKILGFAYDGNPIYGPYGYSDPLDSLSAVSRLSTGYSLNLNRATGPSTAIYPLGVFDEDYTWTPSAQSGKLELDENNGRYCVTPEYPDGVYAYFITIDVSGNPEYPYIVGKNYYGVPVDSNYNSELTQNQIPKAAKLLDFSEYLENGKDFSAVVDTVQPGTISGFQLDNFTTTHKPKNKVFFDNTGTSGINLTAEVETVFGEDVEYINAKQSVALLSSISEVYLFDEFILRQQNSLIESNIVGDVLFDQTIVLENIPQNFTDDDKFDLIDPSTNQIVKVLNVLLPENASFTANSTIILTDGFNNPDSVKAEGIILESTVRQNTVRIKVTDGDFSLGVNNQSLRLRSSTLSDSVGVTITSVRSLSEDIAINFIDYNYAIVKTEVDHNLKINEEVDISINPDDAQTEKTYFVRKRIFQEIKLNDQFLNTKLFDTGIGKLGILNGGLFRSTGVFTTSLGNASVDITISAFDNFNQPILAITNPGIGYTVGQRIRTQSPSGSDGEGLFINIDEVDVNGSILSVSISEIGTGYEQNVILDVVQTGGQNANIEVTFPIYNSVSNVTITDKGSDFKEDQILFFETQLVTDPIDPSKLVFLTDFGVYMELDYRFTAIVEHVGLSVENTVLQVNNVNNVSQDDLLTIDNEVVKVTGVDYTNKLITVERGQEGSTAVEHFNGAPIIFYDFVYRFTPGSYIDEIGSDPNINPTVFSYDPETNILILSWNNNLPQPNLLPDLSTAESLTINSFFKDQSVGKKDVGFAFVGEKKYKLEFSEDDENNFKVNPNIDIQNLYKYKFDTSHRSMVGTYLDFSPSTNYSIITQEKNVSEFEPGNAGAFISLKFGFGPALQTNSYDTKVASNFSVYYYFIVAGGVDTQNSSLTIVQDPLIGKKFINYVTNNKFTYPINFQPQENATGEILYTTSGENAIGIVNTIKTLNPGKNYLDVPVVKGIEVPTIRRCVAAANIQNGSLVSFTILDPGSGYVEAQILIDDGDDGGIYRPIVIDGSINAIQVLTPGKGHSQIPTVKVLEKSNSVYALSNNIGIPNSIRINNPGKLFDANFSTIPSYTSNYSLLLSNLENSNFVAGKKINQIDSNGNVIFSGVVTSYRKGSNIVKIVNITGEISKKYKINGADIVAILYTNYQPVLKSFYDKGGRYITPKGIISDSYAKLTDSYYYQDYSYLIRSKTPIDIWRDLIKDVVHPAGFELFGEVVIEAKPGVIVPVSNVPLSPVSISISAGVKEAFTINSSKIITQRIASCGNTNIQRGTGRVAVLDGIGDKNYAQDVYLLPEFNGYVDSDTRKRRGTKTFTIYDSKTNLPVFPYDETAIVLTLSGVVQEPNVSYTINGSQITFAEAPLGPRISEGQLLSSDPFVGKVFNYNEDEDSQKYFKKVKNIFQRDGIWLDAANQIHFNKEFIVDETYLYITTKYPNLNFDTAKCRRDIGYIVDSFEHDLRFGGNVKTVTSGEFYFTAANELDFINNELEETKEAYFYAAKLCAAAVRNWEVAFIDDPNTLEPEFEVIVSASSDLITVPSTFGLVEGMYLSSGSQFPMNTRIIEIVDETNVRVSNNSFADITENGSIIFEIPAGDVVLPPGGSTEVEFEYNGVNILTDATLIVSDGITVTIESAIARLRQVRFSLGKINTGTFVDAANLISVNRNYIIDETISYIITTFPGFVFPGLTQSKCRRDIGYLIDAVVYHLSFGGNNRIIDYAEKYYLANTLNYINDDLTQTISAFEYAISLMLQAVLDPGAPFSTTPYSVALDEENPLNVCAEVRSAISSYGEIYTDILQNGPNLIQRSFANIQKSGQYTDLLTYSNYNILDDVELQLATEIDGVWFGAECANVISALYTLHQSLDTILTNGKNSIEISLPDYFDGENTNYELYTTDNQPLKTDNGEDLLVFLNGVLQRPSAYTIQRSENNLDPDIIKFSSPPIWDQNSAQLLLNQGTAVEYFHAFSIGPYIRRSIDYKKIKSTSVFQILDSDGFNLITPIYDDRYHLVFVDGVLQRNKIDYVINQTRIAFKKKLNYYESSTGELTTPKVDIISFTGDKNTNILTGFNFLPNELTAVAELELYYDPLEFDFYQVVDQWHGGSAHPGVILADGKPIGSIISYQRIPNNDPYTGIRFRLQVEQRPEEIDSSRPITLSKPQDEGVEDLDFTFAIFIEENLTFPGPETYVYGNIAIGDGFIVTVEETAIVVAADVNLNFETNDNNDIVLERASSPWLFDKDNVKNKQLRTLNRITSKLLEGDRIRLDGEKEFRTVLSVPDKLITTQYNKGRTNTDSHYGNIIVTASDELIPGSGLTITPVLDNQGKIVDILTGKNNALESITKVAINIGLGYVKDTFVEFVPSNGEGGGGLAKVQLWGKTVVGVKILSPGYGYTSQPIPVITRGFDIDKSHRKISPSFKRTVNTYIKNDVILRNKEFTILDPFGPNLINIFIKFYDQTGGDSVVDINQDVSLFLESDVDIEDLSPTFQIEPITLFIPASELSAPIAFATSESETQVESLGGQISPVSLADAGTSTALYTDTFIGQFFGPFNPEAVQISQTLVNIDFLSTDTVLFVTSTEGFPSTGELQVGGEVLSYGSILPDRFFITARELRGSTAEPLVPVGTVVYLYQENININAATRVDVHTEIPEVFEGPTASSEVSFRLVKTENVIQPVVSNDSEVTYFIEDELQTVDIVDIGTSTSLTIQSTPETNLELAGVQESNVTIFVDTALSVDFFVQPAEFTLLIEASIDENAFTAENFNIKESNLTLFNETNLDPELLDISLPDGASLSEFIEVPSVEEVPEETSLFVGITENTYVIITAFIPPELTVTTLGGAVVEPVTKFFDIENTVSVIDANSVSEIINIVEEPASPTPEFEESVLDVSAVTAQSEISVFTSELRNVDLYGDLNNIPEVTSVVLTDIAVIGDPNAESYSDISEVEQVIEKPEPVLDNLPENDTLVNVGIVDAYGVIISVIDQQQISYVKPIIASQEITKFPEDVVTDDDDNLDIELSSEYISGVDLISTVGTVTNVDATINTQIEQGSTDEFIEIINTDEIGLN